MAVSVVPPLLADSLRAMLECDGIELTLSLAGTQELFDVTIVTPGATPAPAEVMVELADEAAGPVGALVRDVSSGLVVRLAELDEVARLLCLLGAARLAGRTPSEAELGLGPPSPDEASKPHL